MSPALRGLAAIALITLLFALISHLGVDYAPETLKGWVDQEISSRGWIGIGLLVAAGALFTGLGFSRQVFALVAGYAFGAAFGTAVSLIAEMAGVAMGFFYARAIGRHAMRRRFPDRIRKVDAFLDESPFLMTLAVRLFPFSHNLVVNVLAGVSRVRPRPFFLASAVGHFPQTFAFALVGSGVAANDYLKSLIAAGMFLISVAIGWELYRRYRRGQVFAGTTADIVQMEREAQHANPESAD